jgi:hypothetical protein
MKTIYVLYANKPGNPDYLEDIITETTDLNHLEKAKKWAADNGFISLRIHKFRYSQNDFNHMVSAFAGGVVRN